MEEILVTARPLQIRHFHSAGLNSQNENSGLLAHLEKLSSIPVMWECSRKSFRIDAASAGEELNSARRMTCAESCRFRSNLAFARSNLATLGFAVN
jgi:hypothetical protein